MSRKIKILIAEDSKVVTSLLKIMLNDEPDCEVVACVDNGIDAVAMTKKLNPDLITMDINMPKMDGVEAIRIIMSECPKPIVVISAESDKSDVVFEALQAGALTMIGKPENVLSAGFEANKRSLLNTIRALSEVRVTRRRKKIVHDERIKKPTHLPTDKQISIVALGASTGGPEALFQIITQLPADFSVPIAIVQHISDGFLPGLVNWLQHKSALKIEIAQDQQLLQKGSVYFAPNNKHLIIKATVLGPMSVLEDSDLVDGFKPSVTQLFVSIANAYPKKAIAGLLTGMGRDGAEGLLKLKQSGSYSFIQSEASSIVFGMPKSAKLLSAECDIVDLHNIALLLNSFFSKEIGNEKKDIGRG